MKALQDAAGDGGSTPLAGGGAGLSAVTAELRSAESGLSAVRLQLKWLGSEASCSLVSCLRCGSVVSTAATVCVGLCAPLCCRHGRGAARRARRGEHHSHVNGGGGVARQGERGVQDHLGVLVHACCWQSPTRC
jgi:hypothetical protein